MFSPKLGSFLGARICFALVSVLSAHQAVLATEPSGATTISIQDAMRMAEESAVSKKAAEATIEENVAKSRQTMTQMGPSISLESTQAWLSKDVNKMVGKTIGTTVVPSRINTAALVVAQPIIPLGPLYMKLQADLTAVEISREEAKQSKRNAKIAGAEAFIRATKAQEFLGIAEASLTLVEKQRKDGEALFRAGRLTNVDLLRLEMAMADAKAQLAQAKNLNSLALVSLAETVGIQNYSTIVLKPSENALFGQKPIQAQDRDGLVAKSLQERTEVKSAQARIEMAEYYKLASDFDYLPMINAFLKYERDFTKEDTFVPDTQALIGQIVQGSLAAHNIGTAPTGGPVGQNYLIKDIRDNMTVGLSLKWTLWDWGGRWFRSNEFAATLQKARFAREQIESGIRIEATQAVLDLDFAFANLETSKTAVKLAEETYKQQTARFQTGAATVTDIVTAERDQTRARGGLINGRGDLDLAWLKFFRVLAKDPENTKN